MAPPQPPPHSDQAGRRGLPQLVLEYVAGILSSHQTGGTKRGLKRQKRVSLSMGAEPPPPSVRDRLVGLGAYPLAPKDLKEPASSLQLNGQHSSKAGEELARRGLLSSPVVSPFGLETRESQLRPPKTSGTCGCGRACLWLGSQSQWGGAAGTTEAGEYKRVTFALAGVHIAILHFTYTTKNFNRQQRTDNTRASPRRHNRATDIHVTDGGRAEPTPSLHIGALGTPRHQSKPGHHIDCKVCLDSLGAWERDLQGELFWP